VCCQLTAGYFCGPCTVGCSMHWLGGREHVCMHAQKDYCGRSECICLELCTCSLPPPVSNSCCTHCIYFQLCSYTNIQSAHSRP
jgi:hypothetical protein